MSSEVCPFCGKTYKRLKSHLPHCKAAASSKTPKATHDVTATQTKSSSELAAASTAKSTQTPSVTASQQPSKSKKTSVGSAAATQASVSVPPSAKKKKPKLSEQIKTAAISLEKLPLSPSSSKPKKQSLHVLTEAAKSKKVSKGTRPASEDVPSGFLGDLLTSTAEIRTNEASLKDDALPVPLPADSRPRAASKTTASKTQKVAQSRPTADDTSSSLDSKVNEEDSWLDNNMMSLKPGNGHQATITLRDVKATLGRRSGRSSILSRLGTSDDPSGKVTQNNVSSCLVATQSSSPHPESLKTKSLKSEQTALVPLKQPELTFPAAPLLSAQLSSPRISTSEGLKVAGLLSPPSKFSSPLQAETLEAGDGFRSQLQVRKQNTADTSTKGALTQRSLGQVTLRELPCWLACKTPSNPKDMVDMMQRGWRWYYRRYIDVRKGGVGGVSMLLAGYCVLSYIWSYPHIKRDRWRRHH